MLTSYPVCRARCRGRSGRSPRCRTVALAFSSKGAAARELLAQGVPLDFHPDVFRIGQFALTGLHHTPVLIHRRGEDLYELYALRTFGLSVWEWLTDAALPFGYEIAR